MIDPRLTARWYFRAVTQKELAEISRELQDREPSALVDLAFADPIEARVAHRVLLKRGKKPTLHRIIREIRRRQEGVHD